VDADGGGFTGSGAGVELAAGGAGLGGGNATLSTVVVGGALTPGVAAGATGPQAPAKQAAAARRASTESRMAGA
jgi:hypothetical protein